MRRETAGKAACGAVFRHPTAVGTSAVTNGDAVHHLHHTPRLATPPSQRGTLFITLIELRPAVTKGDARHKGGRCSSPSSNFDPLSQTGTLFITLIELRLLRLSTQLARATAEAPAMPRTRRIWTPGAGAHITSRFLDRSWFLTDAIDRAALLTAITVGLPFIADWTLLSWALMSNHIHYAFLAGVTNPERFFRPVHTRLGQHLSRRFGEDSLGRFFADRPTIHPVPDEKLARLVAYQHMNPVRAGIVERPADSRRTSHRVYLRLDPAPPGFDVERGYELLGFPDTAPGRRQFDEFVNEVDLEAFALELARRERPRVIGASPRPLEWALLKSTVERECGVKLESHSRRPAVSLARAVFAIVALEAFHRTGPEVARALGITPGAVYNLVGRNLGSAEVERVVAAVVGRMGEAAA